MILIIINNFFFTILVSNLSDIFRLFLGRFRWDLSIPDGIDCPSHQRNENETSQQHHQLYCGVLLEDAHIFFFPIATKHGIWFSLRHASFQWSHIRFFASLLRSLGYLLLIVSEGTDTAAKIDIWLDRWVSLSVAVVSLVAVCLTRRQHSLVVPHPHLRSVFSLALSILFVVCINFSLLASSEHLCCFGRNLYVFFRYYLSLSRVGYGFFEDVTVMYATVKEP